jgi:hypothetical protein
VYFQVGSTGFDTTAQNLIFLAAERRAVRGGGLLVLVQVVVLGIGVWGRIHVPYGVKVSYPFYFMTVLYF